MKRLATLASFLLLLAVAAPDQTQAQDWQHQVYFNSGPQFVTGDASDSFKTGLAIDGGYYYRATPNFFIGLAGGYHQFEPKTAGGNKLTVIPAHIAAKYNFSLTGVQPYIGVEGGPYFSNSGGEGETNFGLAPRIGFRIPLSRGFDLDINAKYNVIFQEDSNFNYVGVNGGPAYIPNRTRR